MKAWELVENGWCKSSLATDADFRILSVTDPEACMFCTAGALMRVYGYTSYTELDLSDEAKILAANLDKHALEEGDDATDIIVNWNDRVTTHKQEVVRVLQGLNL